MAEPVFEVYKDKAGAWRWRLKGSNNEIIATGKGCKEKAGCEDGIASVKKNAQIAKIVEVSKVK